MVRISKTLFCATLLAALGAAVCSAAPMDGTVAIEATLSAASEVPPTASSGHGMLEANFNKETSVLNYTVTYSGLTGPAKAGHFHGPAAMGSNAGVALPFVGSVESPIKGSATLSPAQAADLLAGKWYVNLHTAANAGGEIRGQALTK
jgi:hypothetical protein